MENLGLRDRQRARRHRAILFSAAELFGTKGFAETTMEDIASMAEVSAPTIYNYFRSKSDILLGLLEVDKELINEALEDLINNPNGDPLEVISEFVRIDLEGGYDVHQKSLWRMISAAALEASDDRAPDYVEAQSVFFQKLCRLIECLKRDGKVSSDVDPKVAARVINSITRESFRLYIRSEELTIPDLVGMAREQLAVLWNGLKS
ncbi:MAG: TetR/AcrR family transcriptional regulator [Rhizobiaceae bacterium]|nr:TetR/AcrR family transcriptional regulator [Rhizobiaceae bacterium]